MGEVFAMSYIILISLLCFMASIGILVLIWLVVELAMQLVERSRVK